MGVAKLKEINFPYSKICRKCAVDKPLEAFRKDKKGKYGRSFACRDCRNKVDSAYYQNHKDQRKIDDKLYRARTIESRAIYQKNYRAKNKTINHAKQKQWRLDNSEHVKKRNREWHQFRIWNDINFRIKKNLRNRLYMALKNNSKRGSAVKDLGCTINYLRAYLTSKFESGMNWKNYGEWEIDHIIPLASFDLTDRSNFLKASHYKNLQPLWAIDNIIKGSKIG